MRQLLAFGGLAHDPQRVLATIQRLAFVTGEKRLNLPLRWLFFCQLRFKLAVACFAYSVNETGDTSYNTQLSLWHTASLAPNACENETAPLP
jgi:hypothetical protein